MKLLSRSTVSSGLCFALVREAADFPTPQLHRGLQAARLFSALPLSFVLLLTLLRLGPLAENREERRERFLLSFFFFVYIRLSVFEWECFLYAGTVFFFFLG